MEGNFVADVRLDDSDEVLQLPIVKHRLKKLLSQAVKKIAIAGAPVIPSSDDSLEQFLSAAGKFFGKDPTKWEHMGEPKVEVSEDQGKRYIKSTGVFSGTELHLFVENPFHDERLPVRNDKPELNFDQKKVVIASDEAWQEAIADQPWTMSKRRQMLTAYLQAKLEADDGELAAEGCHGFWELSIAKENHADIRIDRLAALLSRLNSQDIGVATIAAAAVWGLATTAGCRRSLADLDVVSMLVANLKRTLKVVPYPDPEDGEELGGDEGIPEGAITESQRAGLQRMLLGALAILMIDRNCRRPYLMLEPDFATLFTLCKNLEGYKPHDAQVRRETSAKILTSLIQRDADARQSLIVSGSLRSVLVLLNPQGPGENMIQFCMASLLATLVLDDDAMDIIKERGEAPLLFEACIVLLTSTLDKLHVELERQLSGYYQDEMQEPEFDLALGVRLAEAASQAMWGSAHYCVMMNPIKVKMEHVIELGKMGMDCVATDQLPLSRVCHCVTATLATLSSHPETADLIMTCPDDLALSTLMTLVEVFETENFERAGHVKASACAGIAFLACHPIGAEGDDCMHGPYRTKLLEMGAFGALLRAALTSVMDPECDMIVQQAAAIGVMYLSTMAGAVDASELAMYAALLMDSDNSEMIEFLMAGMWILLRNPENRKVLGTAFNPNPGNTVAKGMMNKLNDAITLHEIHDQAQEKAALIRNAVHTDDKGGEQEQQAGEGGAAEGEGGEEPTGTRPSSAKSGAAGLEAIEGMGDGDTPGGAERRMSGLQASTSGVAPGAEGGMGGDRSSLQGEPAGGEGGEARPSLKAGLPASLVSSRRGSTQGSSRAPLRAAAEGQAYKGGLPDDDENAGARALAKAPSVKKQAQEVQAKFKGQLDKKFDKQLKDNWGLETLVTVGESWLPAMLEQDNMGEANDIPVLKLFEFLVASICLFMIEDDVPSEQRELDMFKLTAPQGVKHQTWWTVDAKAPEPEPVVELQMERALSILIQIVGMRLSASWKSVQLGVLTLWNACSRNGSMERHVVEHGVCGRLLDIVNNTLWPPSLREIAGGCLEFFCERYSNLAHYPKVPLPDDIQWPFQRLPDDGLVPTVAAYINLINSRIPLLEYRGCHGIARVCFAAPYGTPEPRELLKQAKAVSAVLGAVDAAIALVKRVNKRYQDIISGKVAPRPNAKKQKSMHETGRPKTAAQLAKEQANRDLEDDSYMYEKDMTTLEAMQDIYFVLFALLLNVSVLKSVQPMVAKKGLMVLLGTNGLLHGRVNVPKPNPNEEKLLHLCSAIIQNISLHPQNRTRLYKAELKGSVALDKLIEAAVDADDDAELKELKEAAPFLPSIGAGRGAGGPSGSSSTGPSPRRSMSPTKLSKTATRKAHLSPNGQVLNQSLDMSLASTVRPKVVFPPIVEKRENVWPQRQGAGGQPGPSSRYSQVGLGSAQSDTIPDEDDRSAGASGYDHAQQEQYDTNDSRSRFLHWLDSTFAGDGGDGPSGSSGPFGIDKDSGKRTHRKQMWDEHGDWLPTEIESAKALNKILARPLKQMWNDSPEARTRHGQARWCPKVSEYREAEPDSQLGRSAAKLLVTKPPKDEAELMLAATQVMTVGQFDLANLGMTTSPRVTAAIEKAAREAGGNGRSPMSAFQAMLAEANEADRSGSGAMSPVGDGSIVMTDGYTSKRPATATRREGRVGLTVLRANADVALAAQEAASAAAAAESESNTFNSNVFEGMDSPFKPEAHTGPMRAAKEAASNAALQTAKPVALKVCIGPQRARQVISFEDRVMLNDDMTRPQLTMFEHVEGSRVCDGLFPSYQLPNGKQAYMYYNGGSLLDEVSVDAVQPPPRPSTVPQALQQTMPLADVLNLIAKPPGSAPPFIPYKPVPYLVPLPRQHTLNVKRPDLLVSSAFGDLREDNIQLIIQAKKIIKTQTTTRVEAIEVKLVEERDPWQLPLSIFKPRLKEADCRAFYDTEQSEDKMFERDWQRACSKEKFSSMLARENKACKAGKSDVQMLKEVHDVLLQYYKRWYSAFVYYGTQSSGDPYHMSLNAYTTFLDECQIADAESQYIKRSDCDTIFIVCNFMPDKKSPEAAVNNENSMMRYEFLECLVRCAIAKYGKGQSTDDVPEAVRMLLEANVDTNLPPAARHITNEFRDSRLYNEEVDLLFKRHVVMLKALYSRYRLKPAGGGLRPKMLKLDGWLQLLSDTHAVDSQFTLQDGTLCFLWSRMFVLDEIKDYARYTSLTFTDFLEALGRVADYKSLPPAADLETAGYNNIMEWALEKDRVEGPESGDSTQQGRNPEIFKNRDSSGFDSTKNRPLYQKLEVMLDLMFRRLYWDPANPDGPFNYDGLLKLIKKVDKDLGP